MSSEATTARLELMQAKIALDLAKSRVEFSETDETKQLRHQITELNTIIAREIRLLGPEHQRIKNLRMNKAGLEDQLKNSLQRAATENIANAERRVEIAERRFKEVNFALDQDDQLTFSQADNISSLTALDREIETLKSQIASIVERRERIRLEGAVDQSLATHLTRATVPAAPVFPRPSLVLGFALGFGFPFGLGVAFLREMLDRRIRLPKDVESYIEVPLLAVVPMTGMKRLPFRQAIRSDVESPKVYQQRAG
jgi:uncharacterized protein involved in exopolysaccharide biosynthesis